MNNPLVDVILDYIEEEQEKEKMRGKYLLDFAEEIYFTGSNLTPLSQTDAKIILEGIEEELFYVIVIAGCKGSGKTSTAKAMTSRFIGEKPVLAITCDMLEDIPVKLVEYIDRTMMLYRGVQRV